MSVPDNPLLPSDLIDLAKHGLIPIESVATDTETSGLFADDGARVSTASVAWVDDVDRNWRDRPLADRVNVEEFQFHPDADPVWVVSLAWPFDQGREGKPEDNGQTMLFPEAENLSQAEWEALLQWLTMCPGGLDFHNSKFDVEKYRVGVRRWPGVGVDLIDHIAWDTQNVNHLLWPLLLHPETFKPTTSLKPSSQVKFGMEVADESKLVQRYLRKAKLPAGRWDLMPWSVIGSYADQDARLTKGLRLRQEWDIQHGEAGEWLGSAEDVYRAIKRRLDTTKVLIREEQRGLPYDEAESNIAALECDKRAEQAALELPFEPPTRDAAVNFFFTDKTTKRGVDGLDLVPYATSEKTGEPSLTAEILGRMVADRVPYADKWAEYTKVTTASSMWYRGYADKMGSDGRLRTCFRQNGTRSSRFSVERVNLQAIPQDYRLSDHQILSGIPTPRDLITQAVAALEMDGVRWRIYELDLAQAELRAGALFAGDDKMLEMIRNGDDLHTYTTRNLFPDVDPADPLFKSKYRQVGKRGNFSLGFGSEWRTFKGMVSKEVGVRLEDAESMRIVREWNQLFPAWRRAIDRHSRRVALRQARHGYGWVDLVNKERRWFDKYEESHKAFNQRVQANLAQFGIDWMLMTDHFLRQQGLDAYGAGLVLTVHDSQDLLLPDTPEGKAMAEKCASFGEYLWGEWFPEVPGAVDYKAWGE